MKIKTLNSKEASDVMPTECASMVEAGELVMGALQMPCPDDDSWPSWYDLEREAQSRFGAVRIADCEPYDDEETVTWLVVRI